MEKIYVDAGCLENELILINVIRYDQHAIVTRNYRNWEKLGISLSFTVYKLMKFSYYSILIDMEK